MLTSVVLATYYAARYGWRRVHNAASVHQAEFSQAESGMKTIPLQEIEMLFADTDRFIDQHGRLALVIIGCSSLAALPVLFHLKRRGLSRCVAWREHNGLAVSALR